MPQQQQQHPSLSRPRRLLPYWRLVAVLGLTAALVPFWMLQNHDATSTFRYNPLEKNLLHPPPNKPRGTKRSSSTATTNVTKQKSPEEREVLLLVNNNETTKEATTTHAPLPHDQPQLHIVFSTSCTDQQHWESYVFFYHCHRVQQQQYGTVTRIVSGCTEAQMTALTLFHQRYVTPLNPAYFVHFTPDYSRVALEDGKRPYKYNNKPFGLLHYLEHHMHHFVNEEQDVIALLDPDMVLLQPLPSDFRQAKNMMWVGRKGNNDSNNKPALWWNQVTLGQPIAQQDGYLNNEWTRFDRTTIFANLSSPLRNVPSPPSPTDAVQRYNAGPPYLATVADWRKLARRWTQLAPSVLAIFPKLFAEMYSFVWATVYEQSPWQMTASLTISTTESSDREGWAYIDRLPANDVCQIARDAVTNGTEYVLPVSLHYCGIYSLDRFLWSKYRVKKNIMNCEKNLLKVPYHLQDVLLSTTGDAFTADWPPQSNGKPSTSTPRRMSRRTAQRELFMLCALTTAVNEALRHYKHLACNGTTFDTVANLNETYEIFIDYSDY
jgi:peptidyl serine alpha-galactosyltransferase